MENLKELLGSGNLSVVTYFSETWKFFKKLITGEKKWIFFIFSASVISRGSYIIFLQRYNDFLKDTASDKAGTMPKLTEGLLILFTALIAVYILYSLFLRKVINKIEGKRGISFRKALFRAFIVTLLIIAGAFFTAISLNNFPMLVVVPMITVFNFLYFIPLYMARDISFSEAASYNFYLCRNNRLRIILPLFVMFFTMTSLFSGFEIFISMFGGRKTAENIINYIFPFFDTFVTSNTIIMAAIIYLNREYTDMRNRETV